MQKLVKGIDIVSSAILPARAALTADHFDGQFLRNNCCDFSLNRKHVSHRPVKNLRPAGKSRLNVDQLS